MKQSLKLFFILLLTQSCTPLHAQQLTGQARMDSLLNELPKQKDDTNKVNLLNTLSVSYYSNNPDEGIKYGQQGLELATKLDWKTGIAMANNRVGNNYHSKSDYPKALEYYFKSLKMNEEIGNKKGAAGVTCNIGIIYSMQRNYPQALAYLFKALKVDEAEGYKQYASTVTGNIGIVYKELKDYPKALEYDFKVLKLYEELGDKGGIARVTGNIGIVYKDQKNYITAVEFLQRALKLNTEMGGKYVIADNLCNIGLTYIAIINEGDVKTASVTGTSELSGNKFVPTATIPHGKPALLSGAIDNLQRGLATGKEIKALDRVQACYEGLTDAYKLKGDYKKAIEYGDSAKVIKDSVFSLASRDRIAKLENDRKQYGDSVKVAGEKKAADVKAAHRLNYELIGVAVLLLALGFIFLLNKNLKLLGKEKKKSDNLLLNILPEEVATQLKDTGAAAARQFDDVTVLFTDFVNFTEAGSHMSPQALIEELNTCFKKFDEITGKYNVEKIKTIGDAYLAVCGLPTPDSKHAENVVQAAKEIATFMQDRHAKLGNKTFEIRLGIHSGNVVAGIVGVKKFAYDIWGDTVNTAARMEQNSEAGKINISETTYELVKDKFKCEYRGEIEAKGKGAMKMYYV